MFQYQKRLSALEKELRETEAEESKNVKLKTVMKAVVISVVLSPCIFLQHTRIMEQVFATYFWILKKKDPGDLVEPVLEGLSKFSHLINLEFIDDIMKCLLELAGSGVSPSQFLHSA